MMSSVLTCTLWSEFLIMTNKKYSFRPLTVSAFVVLAAFALGAPTANADKGKSQSANSVLGLTSNADSAKTTLRIKGSSTPTFTVYKLENPSRVVVDLVGASLKTKGQREANKSVWNVNSWAVGLVSAHNMSKARGSLVRVVVGLSRPSRYQVKASGNDVLIEVTAKDKPQGISPTDFKRAQSENASARLAAEKELAAVRAEAKKIKLDAAKRDLEAKSRIAKAERMMAEAKERSAAASKASRLASSEMAKAKQRENSALAAESSAETKRGELEKAEAAAQAAQLKAEKAIARNAGDSKSLQAKAASAARAAETRRKQAEKAMRVAEARRKTAEQASRAAEDRRKDASDALRLAEGERESAEALRDRALASSKSANRERLSAQSAAKTAASRAQELKDLVRAEESRFEAARNLRTQEESAVARATKAKASSQRQAASARAAQEKLTRDIATLSKAKKQAQLRRAAAEKALAKANSAASDSTTTSAERTRLTKDARRLAAANTAADKALLKQEGMLQNQRQQVALLDAKRKSASQQLATLEKEASNVIAKRSAEEKRLAVLMSKRSNMKLQLDEARKMRIDAQNELVKAKTARVAADASLARTEQKETEVQKELELAKRARLAAESDRRTIALEMKRAKLHEVEATRRLKASKRSNKSSTARDNKRVVAAEAALEEARSERRLAEAARLSGEQALGLANQREKSASAKLALANKTGPGVKRLAPKTRLSEIDVVEKQDVTRVVIAMSSPASPKVISNRGGEAVLEIPFAAIRNKQERTLDTSSLKGAVKSVSTYRDPKDPNKVKVVVDLNGPSKGVLKKIGNTFYWEFPKITKAPTVVARAKTKGQGRTTSIRSQSVAGYGSASSPITQQTVAQVSRRRTKTYRGQKIDLDYKKSDIHDLMRLLADVGGVNIIVPDDISARVTIRLRRVPWDQALDVILASKGLGYKLEGPGLFRISTQKELDAPKPEIFNLNYVNAAAVQAQLESLLSRKGSVQVDSRTNAVIVNDVAANRRRIINLLTRLDTQTPQIQIEARIVEARSTFVRQFGIQWGGNVNASAAGGNATGLIFPSSIGLAGAADDGTTPTAGVNASPTDFAVNLPAAIGTGSGGGLGLSLGSLGGNLGLNLRLSALEDEGSVRIISSPKITTSNNSEASIKSGVSIPISVVSANGVQTQFVPADLELNVIPTVSLRDCAVSMDIDVKKNEADFVNTGARGDPTLLTKEAKTKILVQDGDTTVIGGIYTRNSGVSYSKVPVLGDLPIFGWLFKTTQSNDERTEVLIFITPKITNRAFLPCSD
jgi:type IV pilus assembly protein PilQ